MDCIHVCFLLWYWICIFIFIFQLQSSWTIQVGYIPAPNLYEGWAVVSYSQRRLFSPLSILAKAVKFSCLPVPLGKISFQWIISIMIHPFEGSSCMWGSQFHLPTFNGPKPQSLFHYWCSNLRLLRPANLPETSSTSAYSLSMLSSPSCFCCWQPFLIVHELISMGVYCILTSIYRGFITGVFSSYLVCYFARNRTHFHLIFLLFFSVWFFFSFWFPFFFLPFNFWYLPFRMHVFL